MVYVREAVNDRGSSLIFAGRCADFGALGVWVVSFATDCETLVTPWARVPLTDATVEFTADWLSGTIGRAARSGGASGGGNV